jgi:hypothetical protein
VTHRVAKVDEPDQLAAQRIELEVDGLDHPKREGNPLPERRTEPSVRARKLARCCPQRQRNLGEHARAAPAAWEDGCADGASASASCPPLLMPGAAGSREVTAVSPGSTASKERAAHLSGLARKTPSIIISGAALPIADRDKPGRSRIRC